jgi:hypothetical protein
MAQLLVVKHRMQPDQMNRLFLPRSFRERFWLVLLGGGFAAFMVFIESLMFQWHSIGIAEHIVHFLADDTFITFGLFSCLTCVWGLFAPRWMETFLERSFQRVLKIITVIAVASVLSVISFLLSR